MTIRVDVPECAACGCSTHHSARLGSCCGDRPGCKADHAFEPVEMAGTNAAYTALKAEADAVGWPLAYTSDLFRDWQATQRRGAGQPFVWVLREHGTDLLWLEGAPGPDRAFAVAWGRALADARHGTAHRWYVWSGRTLRPVAPDRALEALQRPGGLLRQIAAVEPVEDAFVAASEEDAP